MPYIWQRTNEKGLHSMETLVAYPGHALIGMKPRYGDFEGQIAIPGSARSRKTVARLGQVCSINPYPEGRDSAVYEHGELVARPAWRNNNVYTELLGQWVLVRHAVRLFGELFSVRLEFIESLADKDIEPKPSGAKRCFQCKSKGEANILLGADGFCPVCGFNEYHEHIDDRDLRALFGNDEDLRDQFMRIPAEVQHVMNGGGALDGKIYSYAGQKNRSALSKALVSDIVYKRLKD